MSRLLKKGAGARVVVHEKVVDARLAADRILRQAEAEVDRIRTQAVAEGRERGLAAVTELLASARVAAARSRQSSSSELRVLAVRIAEKILGRELSLDPDAVVDTVTQALLAAATARQVTIRCHPDDLAALERGKPRLLQRCARAQAVQLQADPGVGRGGCIVDTELATIDARLHTQLEAIERALRGDEGT